MARARYIPVRELHTRKVALRPPGLLDVKAIYDCLRDPAMQQFVTVPHPYRFRHAAAYVLKAWWGRWTGTRADHLVVDRESGALMACRMVFRIRWRHPREAELGAWVARPYWSAHLNEEIDHVHLPYLFVTLGIHRIVMRVRTDNAGAVGAILRSPFGCVHEGTLRDARYQYGRFHDIGVYTLFSSHPAMQPWIARYRRDHTGGPRVA